MQSQLIKSESKLITLETDLREMKSDYESKITNLESTIAAKDIHIKQLVFTKRFIGSDQRMSPGCYPLIPQNMKSKASLNKYVNLFIL